MELLSFLLLTLNHLQCVSRGGWELPCCLVTWNANGFLGTDSQCRPATSLLKSCSKIWFLHSYRRTGMLGYMCNIYHTTRWCAESQSPVLNRVYQTTLPSLPLPCNTFPQNQVSHPKSQISRDKSYKELPSCQWNRSNQKVLPCSTNSLWTMENCLNPVYCISNVLN